MKGISVLGSTGSIGEQTLDIVRLHPDRFRVVALAAGANVELIDRQVKEFRPAIVTCRDETGARELMRRLRDMPEPVWVGHSAEGLSIAATAPDADLVVMGLPGSAGLVPSFEAVASGKDIALATKEVLVMAGRLFMDTVQRTGVNLLPVDSEQSAIFQCLQGNRGAEVRRLILTASGGPFRDMSRDDMERVTVGQTLNHPRWKMGPKVTVDSATLMNKGFEVIEAMWLFGVAASRIEVVIHPQSIVHSMVEFQDGSILAQLGATDMRIPIGYAMGFPERIASGTEPLSFPALGALTFREPDVDRFPLLKAACDVATEGDTTRSVVLNAADEVAVGLFLSGAIPFHRIPEIVLDALHAIPPVSAPTLADIVEFHEEVTERVTRGWKRYSNEE
jgi:1-deoxy-D-xylulose-5-phosphate reductoisomerase